MKSLVKFGFLALLAVGNVGVAMAEDAATTAVKTGPCKEAREKFCVGITEGEGRIYDCLAGHRSELSAECGAKVDHWTQKKSEFNSTCEADRTKFCSSFAQGTSDCAHCLDSHISELSSGCRDMINRGKAKHQKRQEKRKQNQAN